MVMSGKKMQSNENDHKRKRMRKISNFFSLHSFAYLVLEMNINNNTDNTTGRQNEPLSFFLSFFFLLHPMKHNLVYPFNQKKKQANYISCNLVCVRVSVFQSKNTTKKKNKNKITRQPSFQYKKALEYHEFCTCVIIIIINQLWIGSFVKKKIFFS